MKKIKGLLFLLLTIAVLMPRGSTRADSAPPMEPPGGDVSPEGGTEVQMVAEQVVMDFRQSTDDSAQVSAWFLFHNTSDVDENLKVRFPLNGDERDFLNPTTGEYEIKYPLIEDFTAKIGNQKLSTQTIEDTDPNAEQFFLGGQIIYWSVFDMNFPAGKDVKLTVTYTARPSVEASYGLLSYILATGAGWKGPIGEVDIIYRFPYILSDVNFPDRDWLEKWGYQVGSTITIEENSVRIHWDNLEPTFNDNVSIVFRLPHLWQEVLRWRLAVIAAPDSATAWESLAGALANAGQEHHFMLGNQQMAEEYLTACERALTLDPNNAEFHAEFAQNLAYAMVYRDDDPYYNSIVLNEIATALKLDPRNKTALDALASLDYLGESQADLPTPGPFPTRSRPTPTLELEPTFTLASTSMPTRTPVPTMIATQSPSETSTQLPEPSATQDGIEAKPHANASGMMAFSGTLLIIAGWVTWKSVRGKKN